MMLYLVLAIQVATFVDSSVEPTRVFWRKKYFDVTDDEARDPRPFSQVLADRAAMAGTVIGVVR